MARYRKNGRLDRSFGQAGSLSTDFGGLDEAQGSMAVQKDGRIVVAGFTEHALLQQVAVARYLAR